MSDQDKCSQFHKQLVDEFVDHTRNNIVTRKDELCYIINKNQFMSSNNLKFAIPNNFINDVMSFISPQIAKQTKVDLSQCKKIPQTKNEYRKIARNRLNRYKPKFLGNYVFGPLIFDHLYQFIINHGISIFINIFEDILSPSSVVTFEQSRAQPLIPYNTFVTGNKFLNSCCRLLKYYSLNKEWSKLKKSKKSNARYVWSSFVQCIKIIHHKKHSVTPPISLFGTDINWTTSKPIIPITANKFDRDHNKNRKQNNNYHTQNNTVNHGHSLQPEPSNVAIYNDFDSNNNNHHQHQFLHNNSPYNYYGSHQSNRSNVTNTMPSSQQTNSRALHVDNDMNCNCNCHHPCTQNYSFSDQTGRSSNNNNLNSVNNDDGFMFGWDEKQTHISTEFVPVNHNSLNSIEDNDIFDDLITINYDSHFYDTSTPYNYI